MKIFVAILLLAASVTAQSARGNIIQSARPTGAQAAPNPAPAAAAAAPAPAAPVPSAAAPQAAAAPSRADPFATCPQCFGPGVNNPLARAPVPFILKKSRDIVANTPNVRLFIDVDGSITPTDQFGREVEVQDRFGNDAFDFEEQLEVQQANLRQQQTLQAQRFRLEQELASIMRLIGGGNAAGAAQGGPANAGPGFIVRA